MIKHTPEPWILDEYRSPKSGRETVVLSGFAISCGPRNYVAEANTARIVACVNACAGRDPAQMRELADEAYPGIAFDFEEAKRQRDVLLAALHFVRRGVATGAIKGKNIIDTSRMDVSKLPVQTLGEYLDAAIAKVQP